MKYLVQYVEDASEKEFKTINDALKDVRRTLNEKYAEGWIVTSDSGHTSDFYIEKDFSVNGVGNREWVIGRDISVANSWRAFACIEEVKEDCDIPEERLYKLAVLAKDLIDADNDVAEHGWNSRNEIWHDKAKSRLSDFVGTVMKTKIVKDGK